MTKIFTFHYFPGFAAALSPKQDNISLCNNSGMETPLLAEKGLKWETIWSDIFITSMLRSESIHLAHCAKRCKKSGCWSPHTPKFAAHCRRQRGSGRISLGRRIKGWEVTWFRKRRDGAVDIISWESFNACFRSISTCCSSSADDETCKRKTAWITNNDGSFSLNLLKLY